MTRINNWGYKAGVPEEILRSYKEELGGKSLDNQQGPVDESVRDDYEQGLDVRHLTLASPVEGTVDNNYVRLFGQRSVEGRDTPSSKVVQKVYENVPWGLHLTGRTPERISEETGIAEDELFPEDAAILYIGDPWQKMGVIKDTSKLTIIDYKYGEIASFDPDAVDIARRSASEAAYISSNVQQILDRISEGDTSRVWLVDFKSQLDRIAERDRVVTYEDMLALANEWKSIKEMIESRYKETGARDSAGDAGNGYGDEDPLAYFRQQCWYDAVARERNLRDTVDWNLFIVPKLEQAYQQWRAKSLPEEDIDRKLAHMATHEVELIRLKKKPKDANVVVAVFPELPFAQDSFDRLVAAWSISVHSLRDADEEDMKVYWDEINRVLKEGGKAYIYPLSWDAVNEEAVLQTVSLVPGLKADIVDDVLILEKGVGAGQDAHEAVAELAV